MNTNRDLNLYVSQTYPLQISKDKWSLSKRTMLSMAIASFMVCTTLPQANASSEKIGDLTIYSASKDGGNVMMMVDVSGSMGVILRETEDRPTPTYWVEGDSILEDYGYSCVGSPNKPNQYIRTARNLLSTNPSYGSSKAIWEPGKIGYVSETQTNADFTRTVTIDAIGTDKKKTEKTETYQLSGCLAGGWQGGAWSTTLASTDTNYHPLQLDRISELKDALIQSLGKNNDGSYRIASKNLIGLGVFPAAVASEDRGISGKITVPSQRLDAIYIYTPSTKTYSLQNPNALLPLNTAKQQVYRTHRERLIYAIQDFDLLGYTPSANAYAEAGAYMNGKTTYSSVTTDTSGMDLSVADAKTGNMYNAPEVTENAQCYGKGIYFLTDGAPNQSEPIKTPKMMNLSLGKSNFACNDTTLLTAGTNSTSGWNCIGSYAKQLRNYGDRTKDIRTATVGFGSSFTSLQSATTKDIINSSKKIETIIDCNTVSASNQDAKNLCLWGMKENYAGATDGVPTDANKLLGGGGFTVATNARDIQDSLRNFVNSFSNEIAPLPAGTITVPTDPYQSSTTLPYAYLPMLEPQVGESVLTWRGNLKKYKTQNGTLYGKNSTALYTSASGDINDRAADLWSQNPPALGNSAVQSGGFYARLQAPSAKGNTKSLDSIRNVLVESYQNSSPASGFVNIKVNNTGKPLEFNLISDPVYNSNGLSFLESKRIMLGFLGYNISDTKVNTSDQSKNIVSLDMNDYLPTEEIRVVGGVIHSKPALVSYSATVNENGIVQPDNRDDYLLFGSMDGALHLVNAKTGEEKWALILQEMFRNQAKAFVQGEKGSGSLKFGVDAPWLVNARYNYNVTTVGSAKTRQVKLFEPTSTDITTTSNYVPMSAYGGFRMGGDGLYALDLTNKNTPKVLFSITPDSSNTNAVLHQNNNGSLVTKTVTQDDYSNVGQIWNTVTPARIHPSDGATKDLDVIIFGGGYDMKYELPTFVPPVLPAPPAVPAAGTRTKGSSIYIADAKTGKQLWKWNNPYNHSIVGGITPLDADSDGLFDHLYFADLGGNLFRADFTYKVNKDDTSKDKGFSEVRVVRLLNSSSALPATQKYLAYRFYNRPVVSIYEDNSNKLFALINIASGDRSSPLSEQRDDNAYANRVYGIIDKDVGLDTILDKDPNDASKYVEPNIKDLTEAKLTKLDTSSLTGSTTSVSTNAQIYNKYCQSATVLCKKKVKIIEGMLDGSKDGWYYPLTRFAGFEDVKNVKAIGDYRVIDSKLFMSVYDHNFTENIDNTCNAHVIGSSEQQLYCLPYGVCMDDTSITGTGGFSPAGKGIQELNFGPLSDDKLNTSVILGTQTISQRIANSVNYGDDAKKVYPTGSPTGGSTTTPTAGAGAPKKVNGDGSMAEIIFSERYILQPTKWYEAE